MLCLALLPQRLLAADGPVLQVLLNDAPPYRIIDDSTRPPRYSGIYVDIARTAAARAGVRLDFMQVPYARAFAMRSEEHTSELQSLMRISYAVFCLKQKRV